MSKQRSVLVGVAVIAGMLCLPGPVAAGGANHVVQVSANSGNTTAIRADVQWAPAGGPSVTSANIASATSTSCAGCRAVAVAFQAIVMTGDPSVVTPGNVAAAANGDCSGCDSFAFAYQDVVTASGPATLSPEGIAALNQIQRRADAIAGSGEADPQMDADLKALAAEFKSAFEANLVVHGPWSAADRVDVQTTS
jgi:putative peptide zinc metalloprotease protein